MLLFISIFICFHREVVRRPLEEKNKSLDESLYANNPVALEKLQKLKDLELEKESILSGIRKRCVSGNEINVAGSCYLWSSCLQNCSD